MNTLSKEEALDKPAKLLIAINACFAVSLALSNIFVNVYLFKIENDFLTVGLFNLYQYVAIALAFLLAGWIAKRWQSAGILRIGVIVLALFFLAVLALGRKANDNIFWLGLAMGTGNGFYWLGYNVLYFEISGPKNRDRYNGADGLFSSTANVIAPLVSGWVISRMANEKGYMLVFFVSLVIFTLAVVLTFFLPQRKSGHGYRLREVWKKSRGQTRWHYAMLAMVAQGFPDAIFAFLIGLLVYVVTKSEWRLGLFGFITSGVALVSYYLVGRFMKKKWRPLFVLLGALMMSAAMIPSLIQTRYWTILLFGIGMSLFTPFFLIPLTSTVFDLIGVTKKTVELRVEHVVIRELALSVGRIAGLLAFLLIVSLTEKPGHLLLLVLILTLVQVSAWLSMRKINET